MTRPLARIGQCSRPAPGPMGVIARVPLVGEELACQVDEFADELAAQPRPGEGYLEQAAWLFRARAQATEIVVRERVLLPPESADGDDPDEDEENDALPGSGERPVVIDRDHPQ